MNEAFVRLGNKKGRAFAAASPRSYTNSSTGAISISRVLPKFSEAALPPHHLGECIFYFT